MKKNQVIMVVAAAAGAYLLYTYLKNSGLWDQWFGAGAVATQPGTGTTTTTATLPVTTTTPVTQSNGVVPGGVQPGTVTTSGAVASPTDALKAQLLAAAQQDTFFLNQGGRGTADQWNYYRNQLNPPALTGEQMATAFPAGSGQTQMDVDTFLAGIAKLSGGGVSGLGAIVSTEQVSSLPSMTFGGGATRGMRGNMARGMGGKKGLVM